MRVLADPRTGKNGRHHLGGLVRQSVFSRLAGYEDVNDADRLCRDPVMRQLVGGRAVKYGAASASAMGRFETEMLTRPDNLATCVRTLALPKAIETWSLTSLRERLIKTGTRLVRHGRYALFQMA